MKTTLKIGNITIGDVKVSDVSIEQEYTTKDVVELAYNGKNFVKELIKELPEIMDDLYVAFNKFNEIDKKVEEEDIWKITSVKVSKVKEGDFDYCFLNNVDAIRKEITKKKFTSAREGIKATHNMCEQALHKNEIDIQHFVSCTNELQELLIRLETMEQQCSF